MIFYCVTTIRKTIIDHRDKKERRRRGWCDSDEEGGNVRRSSSKGFIKRGVKLIY
jgi:hypothetical protein